MQLTHSRSAQAADKIDQLEAQVAALTLDAERYRWLRDQPSLELRSDGSRWMKDGIPFVASHRLCTRYTAHGHYATLDETIDEAMRDAASIAP